MTFEKSLLKTISESSALVSFLLSLLLNFKQLAAVTVLQQVPYFKPPLLNFLKFICNTKKFRFERQFHKETKDLSQHFCQSPFSFFHVSMMCNQPWHPISTLQRHNTENSKQIFPEKELRSHSPNVHIHVSVSDLYIPTIGLPILLQENMWTDPGK